ncbi:hypothetical protein E4O00_09825 [Treponema sp. OMZ 788]|uniref:hypothetical protein n=1 Tax=unclassified Treponema TaxID=2638727 RepID=UPI0020A5D105|nr:MULTISPECIES: hypothetical protein [unclassified Treponema]UTC63021.1 hypothetical protein E4O05_03745 [Treponema sp. OMZ 787]UTC64143.1 hypothetical protein E4O00_09825 [Treponema sp. OMZ 788]
MEKNIDIKEENYTMKHKTCFLDKCPKLRYFFDWIFKIIFMVFNFIVIPILFVLTFLILLYIIQNIIQKFPLDYKKTISSIISAVFSLVIVPVLLYYFKTLDERKYLIFEKNWDVFEELSGILMEIHRNLQNKGDDKIKLLIKFIQTHEAKIVMLFPDSLNEAIAKLISECDPNKKNDIINKIFYTNNCIKEIRKIAGKGFYSYIPNYLTKNITKKMEEKQK